MKTFAKVSMAILLMAVVAWASDPWKDKPYQDWNQKDIMKVLNDSPWVKTIRVPASWDRPNIMSAGGMSGQPNMAGQQNGTGGQSGMPNHPAVGGGGMPSDNGMGQGVRGMREASFEARWISAKTMREALARMEVLNGKIGQPNAEQFVEETPPDYQIIVFGRDMAPFVKFDEAALAKHSYLQVNRKKVAPANVKLSRGPNGKRVVAATFTFSKTANGEPTIPPKTKSVDLICKLKGATLKFHFDPRKMKDKAGRDL